MTRHLGVTPRQSRLVLSPSTLTLLQECPACLWKHFRGIRRPDRPMPTITLALDRIAKAYVDSYRPQVPPLFAGRLPGELAPVRPAARMTWTDPASDFTVTGALDDYVILPDGLAAPVDFKSRDRAPRVVHPTHQLQLDVYSLLLAEAYGLLVAGRGFLIYLLPTRGQLHRGLPLSVEVIELEASAERARALAREAAAIVRQTTCPQPAPGCAFCRFLQAGTSGASA